MTATANQPAFPSLPFGKLGTQGEFLQIPVGDVSVKLTRKLNKQVEYLPSPVGQGFKDVKWERNQLAEAGVYTLEAETADLSLAVPLAQWREQVTHDFPNQMVSGRGSAGAKRLAEFARGLLTVTARLHRDHWRLGLVDLDNLYLIERDGAISVFLPDLGFAWMGTIALAKPNWLKVDETRDQMLWAEERLTRQYAAPSQYQQFLKTPWEELVQRDLRLVARLLRFLLTGDLAGARPAGAGRCPVWKVIGAAEAGQFQDNETGSAAENMLAALLTGLETRGSAVPSTATGTRGNRTRWWLAAALLVVLGGAVGLGWFFSRETVVQKAIAEVNQTDDIAEKARKAVALSALPGLSPEDRKTIAQVQAATRAQLLDEIKRSWRAAQQGAHLPLRTRELRDLLDKLPDNP